MATTHPYHTYRVYALLLIVAIGFLLLPQIALSAAVTDTVPISYSYSAGGWNDNYVHGTIVAFNYNTTIKEVRLAASTNSTGSIYIIRTANSTVMATSALNAGTRNATFNLNVTNGDSFCIGQVVKAADNVAYKDDAQPDAGTALNWTARCIYSTAGVKSQDTTGRYLQTLEIITDTAGTPIGAASPNITFVNRTPSDITSTALFNSNVTFTYQYNTTGLSTVFIGSYVNSTISNCIVYLNGSCVTTNATTKYTIGTFNATPNLTNVTIGISENDVYPGTSNTNVAIASSNIINISGTNNFYAESYKNISTKNTYGFYEIQLNSTGTVSIYYYNASYNFNSNPTLSPNVHLICNLNGSAINDTHSANNWDLLCPFTVNGTGYIGDVKVTEEGGFITRGNVQGVLLYGYSGSIRTNVSRYSTTSGTSWIEQPYTLRSHVHQFNGNDSFCYAGMGNYTSGSNPQTNGTLCDTLDITPQPPEPPTIYSPNASTYTRFINISYEASIPTTPNSAIRYYNITLLNNDSTFNTTIYGNNSLNTSYYWNTYALNLSTDVYYRIRVTAYDNNSFSSFSISDPFNVSTNSLLTINPRNIFGNTSINNVTSGIITNLVTGENVTSNGTGNITFNVVKGVQYFVNVLPTNFSYANVTITIGNVNSTLTHTYHYTENTFFIVFYNETTNTKLAQNVTLQVISNNYSTNYTVTAGNITLPFLTPNTYTFRYWNNPNVPRDYYVTLRPYSAQNISLYVIDEEISQFYIPTLYDQNINTVANATVQLLRYYVETNSYTVVEMATTNTNGEAVLRVVPNTIYYKMYFIKDGRLLATTPTKLTSQTGAYTIKLLGSIISSYVSGADLYKNLSYNNNTNTFVLTWSDSSNIVTSGCIIVREIDNGVTTILYDTCASGAVGSIPYTIVSYNENNTYTANAWLHTNTQYSDFTVGSLTISPPTLIKTFGLIGILIAVLFVIAFALIGGENGTRGTVVSGILAILLLGVFGIIAYSPTAFIGIIIIGGIIVYKIRG